MPRDCKNGFSATSGKSLRATAVVAAVVAAVFNIAGAAAAAAVPAPAIAPPIAEIIPLMKALSSRISVVVV